MYHTICMSYETKIDAGARPKWRHRLQPNTPAANPCLYLEEGGVYEVPGLRVLVQRVPVLLDLLLNHAKDVLPNYSLSFTLIH